MKKLILFLFLAAQLSGCATNPEEVESDMQPVAAPPPEQPPIGDEVPIAVSDAFILSPDELAKLTSIALEGGAEESLRLFLHYRTIEGPNSELSKKWRQIAAENGSVAGQHWMWVDSQDSSDELERKRGLYWLKKAAETGNEEAIKDLRELNQ